MSYTNSPLVSYTRISPNRTSPRNHKIDTITIHCVVGQCTVERLGDIFAPSSKGASANYGIGYDGRVGMYVEEKDRSWCSSSKSNDHRAVTIEVASDTYHPYAVTEAAYNSLITLVADICKRNDIKELKWKADKSLIGQVDKQNMTVHRWFAAKACPGDFLYSRHYDIMNKVNKLLKQAEEDEDMITQEQFNAMMDKWVAARAQRPGSTWSAEDRQWAIDNGIFQGDENGDMSWQSYITREQVAAVLHRLSETK